MKRLFWTAMGVTVGVIVTRRAGRAVDALTPAGVTERLAGSLTSLGDAVREFGQDVRDAMWDREDALYEALGLDDVPEETPTRTAR
ncbi:MAG TPA: hypothetical protein VE081_07845 [Sporichthyaceae bacterium]|nr:hypothetical protein [Sporichthyaceae bacterium]